MRRITIREYRRMLDRWRELADRERMVRAIYSEARDRTVDYRALCGRAQ